MEDGERLEGQQRRAFQRRLLCALVAVGGVIASCGTFVIMRGAEDRALRAHFERHAVEHGLAIEHHLRDALSAVESVAALFSASDLVTAHEFRVVAEQLLARHRSLRALSWNPRVAEQEREAHELAVRATGRSDYRITERSPDGALVAARTRPEYVVVRYIEPAAGNEAAIGYDVASEARRRAAIARTEETGRPSLTAQIALVQEHDSPGFLAFWPVARRSGAGLEGFAVGVFHLADVIEGALGPAEAPRMTFRVDDITDSASGRPLYSTPNAPQPFASTEGAPFHEALIDEGGRTWRLRFVPADRDLAASPVPQLALLAGLALTALITWFLFSVLRANDVRDLQIARRLQAEQERRRLDAKLQESQKLESLGVLAGGIAHDFNNLLTGILGNTELALQDIEPESPAREELEQVRTAALRAADLTREMLAYAGKRSFRTERIDLSQIVEEMVGLVEASISKGAELRCEFPSGELAIDGDPTQVRQIAMNLITNASDALVGGQGVITVRTGSRRFDANELMEAHLDHLQRPGLYAFLEVLDTGCGMSPADRARMFEPFFTTKFTGRGLGLAAVLGIVRAHAGGIWVESEPGKGTRFTVAFPVSSRAAPPPRRPDSDRAWAGEGTVLVVDDEEPVRRLASRMLRRMGFQVRTAVDGAEAVEVFRAHAGAIRAVLLDLTMPRMGGVEALQAIRAIRADAAVILSSGYAKEDCVDDLDGELPDAFLLKPYTRAGLEDVLRRALG